MNLKHIVLVVEVSSYIEPRLAPRTVYKPQIYAREPLVAQTIPTPAVVYLSLHFILVLDTQSAAVALSCCRMNLPVPVPLAALF